MPGTVRLRVNFGSAVALAVGLAFAGLSSAPAPALAVTPSPPPGAPAVESATSSLVGLDPELPAGVIAASAAPGSHWTPENAVYGTGSTNDIAIRGAGGTTIRVNEIYPTTASGAPAKGPFPVLLRMTPYGKGQGGSSSPGSAASPGGESATGGADDYLVERGYIEAVEDVRGTGDSNGSWGLFDPVQQRDAIKVLAWAAHLPRSDGRVGTYGPSYLPPRSTPRTRSPIRPATPRCSRASPASKPTTQTAWPPTTPPRPRTS
ncbi:MAG TPA: CocE/NonD family hydrolase [Solirubrobacteraceae bacterium]|nr:CocE/NonD family hydrolase [Solirubrobacteraceae bacterium]